MIFTALFLYPLLYRQLLASRYQSVTKYFTDNHVNFFVKFDNTDKCKFIEIDNVEYIGGSDCQATKIHPYGDLPVSSFSPEINHIFNQANILASKVRASTIEGKYINNNIVYISFQRDFSMENEIISLLHYLMSTDHLVFEPMYDLSNRQYHPVYTGGEFKRINSNWYSIRDYD